MTACSFGVHFSLAAAVLLGRSIMKASDKLSSLCCPLGIAGRLLTASLAGVFETGDGFLQVAIADSVGLTGSFAAGDGFAAGNSFSSP